MTAWRNFIGTTPCSLRPLPCGLNRQPSDQGVCNSCHIPAVARLSGGALFLPAAARGSAVAFGSSPLPDNSLRRTGQRAPRPSGASDEAALGRVTELAQHHPRFQPHVVVALQDAFAVVVTGRLAQRQDLPVPLLLGRVVPARWHTQERWTSVVGEGSWTLCVRSGQQLGGGERRRSRPQLRERRPAH